MSETNSSIPTTSPSKSTYYVWPASSATECPEGTGISKEECLYAGIVVSENSVSIENPSDLLENNSNDAPCGCFLRPIGNSMFISFDSGILGCTMDSNVEVNLICKVMCYAQILFAYIFIGIILCSIIMKYFLIQYIQL